MIKPIYFPVLSAESSVIGLKDNNDWQSIKDAVGKRVVDSWTPKEIFHTRNPPKHFAYLSGLIVCDNDVWHLLSETLSTDVEFLPLFNSKETYYLMNIVSNLEGAVDIEKSKVLRDPVSDGILNILSYCFKEERIEGHSLFKIKENHEDVFCSNEFKDIVRTNALRNITFVNVPLRYL